MDHILESLGRIAELSDDELQELKNSVVTEFKTVEKQENSREVVDTLNQLADAADAITAERSRREAEATELAAAREAASARISGVDETATDETDSDNVEDDVDPVTGKKRKKTPAEPEPSAVAEASVNEPAESEASTDVAETVSTNPDEAELGVEQPAVQPEEVKDTPVAGKPDADVTSPAEQAEETPEVFPVVDPDVDVVADAAEKRETDPLVTSTDSEAKAVSEEEETPENKEEDSEDTVTAAGNTPELQAPADRQLAVDASVTAPVTITAGANIQGFTAGSELSGIKDVAKAILARQRSMGSTNPGADDERLHVATFTTTYPEDRQLHSEEREANSDKIAAVLSPQAIMAAGGLCAPVTVSYDIFGFGILGRPVRDSLPSFNADRGGIRFVTPPVLADLNGAVSLWTLQDDIDAATPGAPDPVKPCIRVNCGQEVVVYTDAIPLCLTFGNLNSRAWPELIARHTELGMISHARYAETRLLTRIGALSTSVSATKQLGAARDYFVQLEQAAAGYRNRHRLSPTEKLRVLLPEWFRNALRADLTKQLPGDGQDTTFNLADAQINSFFAARNVVPSWFLDGETGQILATQSAGTLNGFPTTLIWYLFAEGTFLFLDGGTLDLGLVRDSTLNGTNDYKIFLETFEGVAKVGIESLRISSQLGIHGASAATVNTVV